MRRLASKFLTAVLTSGALGTCALFVSSYYPPRFRRDAPEYALEYHRISTSWFLGIALGGDRSVWFHGRRGYVSIIYDVPVDTGHQYQRSRWKIPGFSLRSDVGRICWHGECERTGGTVIPGTCFARVGWLPCWERAVGFPLWVPMVAFAAYPTITLYRGPLRRRYRRRRGLCLNCGYDLRASPEQCPECGCPTVPRKGDTGSARVPSQRAPHDSNPRPGINY